MWWFVLIFIIDFIVSYAWATSVAAISDKKPVKAAFYAGFITLSGGVTIISYTINHWLLIPAVLGSSLGTYLSVKNNKDDSQN